MGNLLIAAKSAKIRELVELLNKASDAYYNKTEIMSDLHYDQLLAELETLEKETGIVLENSPTRNVGYPVKVDRVEKVTHEFPAKSLDKTKDAGQFIEAFNVYGDARDLAVLMWKLDGCTIQLTYDNGKLVTAATRGDGLVGQDITHNASAISGIPLKVKCKSRFTVRGEAVISYSDFAEINSKLEDSQKYKNPRNLASASVTMLDSSQVKNRRIHFKMFELVSHPSMSKWSFFQRLVWFGTFQGFEVVPARLANVHNICCCETLESLIPSPEFDPRNYEYPVDGLVAAFNNTSYTDSLGGTEHHPHILKGYAFKWADELKETTLRKIEWSPSRTGLLNPVAVFDSVDIDGTTVSRASVHNFSIMRQLHLRVGDRIRVYKANLIIPQIADNLSEDIPYSEEDLKIIGDCPSCGSRGVLRKSKDGIESVHCENVNCPAKQIRKFIHFCERIAMNIEGLSEATLTEFVNLGYIAEFADIYTLDKYKNEIIRLDNYGEKSWNNLWTAIHKSRNTTFAKFISGVGIPGIGTSQAKALSKYFNQDIDKFLHASQLEFSTIDGIGEVISQNIADWLNDDTVQTEIANVLEYLIFEASSQASSNKLEGLTFVITGKLNKYSNRKELESEIEANGGKVASSISKNTSYLINNDINSTSSKNKAAKDLGVKIITETEYQSLL